MREGERIARLLLRIPGFARALRWFAGIEPPRTVYTEDGSMARIHADIEAMQADGYTALSSLAAAEALEMGRLLGEGFTYDRIDIDEGTLRWYGVYAVTATGAEISLPLVGATTATQAGVGANN